MMRSRDGLAIVVLCTSLSLISQWVTVDDKIERVQECLERPENSWWAGKRQMEGSLCWSGLDGRSHGAQPSRVASPQFTPLQRENRLRILPIDAAGNLAECRLDAGGAER